MSDAADAEPTIDAATLRELAALSGLRVLAELGGDRGAQCAALLARVRTTNGLARLVRALDLSAERPGGPLHPSPHGGSS